jgi:hypothetical protein
MIGAIGRANLCLIHLIIMINYLVANHIMPKLFHEARRHQWLAIWLLYPYLPYIRALWPHRVFAFQRGPGELEPPCPKLSNYGIVHPVFHVPVLPAEEEVAAETETEEPVEENEEEQFELMDFELDEEFPPW